MPSLAEYIWIDGNKPTQTLRSKTRVVDTDPTRVELSPSAFPEWAFDGSSTYQAKGSDSDCTLKPVCVVNDPIRRDDSHWLVLCEVYGPDGNPHPSNQRAKLRATLAAGGGGHEPWIGFEQEYTLFEHRRPLGWPEGGYPAPQGPFYCGVGADECFGRELVENHTAACLRAGLMLFGTNAEVMPGQWEFQIGHRGFGDEVGDPLTVSDHLWLARWLLYRLGENYGITATLDPKPVRGDWNGAGCHTNFSTAATRASGGLDAIHQATERLRERHQLHIRNYGHGLERRLTGLHETAPIDEFSAGIAHRGSSVRVPRHVADAGCGYFEDRRPGANCDPYVVSRLLIETVCGVTQA